MTTAVVGIGNPILTDDRAGLAVADALRRLLEQEPIHSVDVLTTNRAGLDIIPLLSGYVRAILIDSITVDHPHPGRTHRLSLDEAGAHGFGQSAHEVSVADALRLAERLRIPMPGSIDLFAIEAADVATFSESMTAPVAAAVEPLARQIHAALSATLSLR